MARFTASYVCFTESDFKLTQNISVYLKRKSRNKTITKPDWKIQIFGHVTSCRWTSKFRHLGHSAITFRVIILGVLGPEDKGTRFFRNVRKYYPNGTASHLRTPESSAIPLWEPQMRPRIVKVLLKVRAEFKIYIYIYSCHLIFRTQQLLTCSWILAPGIKPDNSLLSWGPWILFWATRSRFTISRWFNWVKCSRLQLKCDGTRWHTGGEMNGKLANGVGSQYSSQYLGTWCIQHYYR